MTFDVAAVRKSQRLINRAIWSCAGIAMTASAIAGVTGFWNLQPDGWGIASGLTTSIAVDVALWVALTSDQLMERAGLLADGPWARVVRWGTAVMSIVLNVMAAVLSPLSLTRKVFLIVIHAFAPMIMVGLAELRAENGRKLVMAEGLALAEEEARLALEEARRQATDTPIVATSERISPQTEGLAALSHLQPAAALPSPPSPAHPSATFRTVTQLRPATTSTDRERLKATSPRPRPALRTPSSQLSRGTPVRDSVFAWLDTHYEHGQTTVTHIVTALGGSRDTYKKLLAEWRKLNEEKTKEAVS